MPAAKKAAPAAKKSATSANAATQQQAEAVLRDLARRAKEIAFRPAKELKEAV